MSYFFNTIRKTILAFAQQFTNIQIERIDKNNNVQKTITVEMYYQDKRKGYMRLNSNRTTQGITLPAINIYNTDTTYNLSRQQNNLSKILKYDKDNDDIIKAIGTPSPITMKFEVTIWTKYVSDLNKIIETVIPQYQPTKYVGVNILPEMNISINMPIKLVGISDNKELDMDEDPNSTRMLETVLTFEVETFIFPPIVDRKVVKTIKAYGMDTLNSITDEYSPTELISKKLHTLTNYTEELVKTLSVQYSEEKYNQVIVEDLSAEISTYGENLKVVDNSGTEYNFVFGYNNGELYGNDNLIPSGITTTKTGYVYIKIPYIKENTTLDLYVKTSYTENYMFADRVLKYYNDFHIKDYTLLDIADKKEFDYVYMTDNHLYVKTSGVCKIYPSYSVSGAKTIKIGISDFTFEAGKYICGLSDVSENDIIIKTSTIINQYHVYENLTLKGTITSSTLDEITFTYDGVNLVVDIDGNNITFACNDYIIPYIGSDLTEILKINYIKIY